MASILSSKNWYPQSSPAQFGTPQTAPAIPAGSTSPEIDPVAMCNMMVQQVLGSNDPNASFEQILNSVPGAQQVMDWIKQYGNGDPKAGLLNYAAAQGRQAAAQELIQRFGLK